MNIQNGVSEYLKSRDFEKETGNVPDEIVKYVKIERNNKNLIMFDLQINKEKTRLSLTISTRKRFGFIESFLTNNDLKMVKDSRSERYTIHLASQHLNGSLFIEEGALADIDAFLKRLILFLEESIIPNLYEFDNVKKLDAVVNEQLESVKLIWATNYWYYKMIVAKLADNPIYEDLSKSIQKRFKSGIEKYPEQEKYKNYLWVAQALNKKLEKVKPLENPFLI